MYPGPPQARAANLERMISQPLASDTGDIAALGRVILAAVLGFAGWAKFRDWGGFRRVLRFLMPRVPAAAITVLAAGIVGFEILLAGLLVAGVQMDMAAWGTVGFLCAATTTLLVLRRRGYQGGCACFGDHASAGPVGALDVVRNAVLVAVSFAVTQSAAAQPLWALPPATITLASATTVGVLLSYGMVAAVVTMRAAGAPARRAPVAQWEGQGGGGV